MYHLILRGKDMIYFFRGLAVFSLLQIVVLVIFGGAAGMVPVWLGVGIVATLLSFKRIFNKCFKIKLIKVLFTIGMFIFIGVESFIVWSGFKSVPNEACDFIIILGAQVRGNAPSMTLQYRLDSAYNYLIANPQTKAVLSGGQGPDEIMAEAEAMRRYLVEKGIKEERLILEDQSTSTYENLKYSFAIIDEIKSNSSISIVTNHFHVLRARMVARDMGKEVGGVGAKSYFFLIPNYYFREFFAVMKEVIT